MIQIGRCGTGSRAAGGEKGAGRRRGAHAPSHPATSGAK